MPSVKLTPHLTEKSAGLAKAGKFTFLVQGSASTAAIGEIVGKLWHVHPQRIAMVKTPAKTKGFGRRRRTRPAKVKVIVTLKRGEKIADFEVDSSTRSESPRAQSRGEEKKK